MDKLSYINTKFQESQISLSEFAERIGLSYSATQKILKGTRDFDAVSFATVVKLCDTLNINIDILAHMDTIGTAYDEKENSMARVFVNQHENEVLHQYRINIDAQKYIDKILDIDK